MKKLSQARSFQKRSSQELGLQQHHQGCALQATLGNLLIALACVLLVACGGGSKTVKVSTKAGKTDRSSDLKGTTTGGLDPERCRTDVKGRVVKDIDTNADGKVDVRKIFQTIGQKPVARQILICREADLNRDGKRDVVRYYNDEGRPQREEADRDFNGKMDLVSYFDSGFVGREEVDSNADSKVDMKVFYEKGQVIRTERDIAGRSSAEKWQPDRWEYFEEGRLVRMGTDLDGDGQVDRWDRDFELKPVGGGDGGNPYEKEAGKEEAAKEGEGDKAKEGDKSKDEKSKDGDKAKDEKSKDGDKAKDDKAKTKDDKAKTSKKSESTKEKEESDK